MQIKSFCVGNREKSFCIDDFKDGINIIHSDDNDKGKTIVTQGIMYSLGNTPCFPSGFDDFKEYYFITEFECNNKNFIVCRKKDYIFVRADEKFCSFDSINEFKRYFSKEIISLPVINNGSFDSLVGLELFYEMFFMPQDNRTTSNIFNRGRYNKENYIDMLCAIKGAIDDTDYETLQHLKAQIKELKQNREIALKALGFIKSKSFEAKYSSYAVSKELIDNKIKSLDKLQADFTELINKRNRLISKRAKNESLLKEINSLKRNCDEGRLVCLRCGSEQIIYETNDPKIKFEVTDLDTRNEIRNIITERINIINEDLVDLDVLIANKRNEINNLMKDESLTIENFLLYKNEVLQAQRFDSEIIEIDKKLSSLNAQIKLINNSNKEKVITKKQVIAQFVELMNNFYKTINPEDPLRIEYPFTKNDVNYSGSQGVLFIMSRYYAAIKITGYNFPLIIDDFRDGEISTLKESKIIEEFKKLNMQLILTCTLKNEENIKYSDMKDVNDISFDTFDKFHLMQAKYNKLFLSQLSKFNINLDIQ